MKTTMFNGWAAHLKTVSAPTFQTKLWLGPFNIGKEQIVPHILLSEEECEALLRRPPRWTDPDIRWSGGTQTSSPPTKSARTAIPLTSSLEMGCPGYFQVMMKENRFGRNGLLCGLPFYHIKGRGQAS